MTCQLQQQLTSACVLMTSCQIFSHFTQISGRSENSIILSMMYAHAIIIAGCRCTCCGLSWPGQPPAGYHYETMAQIQRKYPRNSYTIMPYWMAAASGKLLGNNQGNKHVARNLPQKGGAPKKNNAPKKNKANKKTPNKEKKPPISKKSDEDPSENESPAANHAPPFPTNPNAAPSKTPATSSETPTGPAETPAQPAATPAQPAATPAVLVKKRKKRDFFGMDPPILHENAAAVVALIVDAGLDERARMFVKNGGAINDDGTAAVDATKVGDNNDGTGDCETNDASAAAKSDEGPQTETGGLTAEWRGRMIIDVSTDVENSMATAAPYLPVINTLAEHIVPGVTPYQVLLIAANVAYITSEATCKNRHRNHVNLLIDVVPQTTALNPHVPARINGHCGIDNASNSSCNKFKNIFQYLYERVRNLLNSTEVSITESNVTEIDDTNNLNDNYCINENFDYYHVDNGKSFERIEKAELSTIDEVRFKQLLLDSNDVQPIFTKMSGNQLVQYFNGLDLQLQQPSIDTRKFFQMLVTTMMNFDKNVADEDIQTLIATLSNVTNFFIIDAILQ
ncbi:Hypothetical protein CINCED_3A015831 [Cinara cedri]|uniref:Uncharacterized protein n=1 Tax=Cinara cedri TaxID=506608 RepID=A0A5E4MXL6_9HEMI|nr:Hypothetical protein CINCED_3A015831 [Cinara cedri]